MNESDNCLQLGKLTGNCWTKIPAAVKWRQSNSGDSQVATVKSMADVLSVLDTKRRNVVKLLQGQDFQTDSARQHFAAAPSTQPRPESDTNVASTVSTLLSKLPALAGVPGIRFSGSEENSRAETRANDAEGSFPLVDQAQHMRFESRENGGAAMDARALELENLQLLAENEHLRQALDDAGESISRLLATERGSLPHSTNVSTCIRLDTTALHHATL